MKKLLMITLLVVFASVGIYTTAVSKNTAGKRITLDAIQSQVPDGRVAVATFAGGCFWCVESGFEKAGGIYEAVSGYSGGVEENPSYEEVSMGRTGHVEAVQVYYDPEQLDYADLLDVFWRQIDPTDSGGQFSDRGDEYRPVIFYHDDKQRQLAEASKAKLQASGRFKKPVTTEIKQFTAFYQAEEYHQDYHKKNPIRYAFYSERSGRVPFLKKTWGDEPKAEKVAVQTAGDASTVEMKMEKSTYQKPSTEALRKMLTPLQYRVTQEEGTERPFDNEYWNEKRDGIYVDITTGEPLFSSTDKYDSKTGWPSFTRPIDTGNIVEKEDYKLFMKRVEVRSRAGDAHLGHLFDDGPAPTGERYCINSASLRFVPKEQLADQGYGEFLKLFE